MLATAFDCLAQPLAHETGLPYLTSYSPASYRAFSQNWAVVQDARGLMYFGNGDGVLEFDGVNWRLIPARNRTAVRCLAIDSAGRIYAGAAREFGYLSPDTQGQLAYVSLLPQLEEQHRDFDRVHNVFATPQGVFFHTDKRIFCLRDTSFRVWAEGPYTLAAWLHDRLYLLHGEKGLCVLESDTLRVLLPRLALPPGPVHALAAYPNGQVLICTNSFPFFLFDGSTLRPFAGPVARRLAGTRMVRARALRGGMLTFATYGQGLVVSDLNGNILRVMDKESGLASDIVFDLVADRQGGLWLATDNGIARAEVFSPLSNFAIENGLEGPVNGLIRHEGRLFAATGLGVYLLQPGNNSGQMARFGLFRDMRMQAFGFLAQGTDLLVAGAGGVFVIRGDQVTKISNMRCSHLYASPFFPGRVYAGTADGVGLIERQGGEWQARGLISGLDKDTRVIYETAPHRLWAGMHAGDILRIELAYGPDAALPDARIQRYGPEQGLPQGYVTVRKVRSRLWFRRDSDLYGFDPLSSRFSRDTSLAGYLGLPDTTFSLNFEDASGDVWFLEKGQTGWQQAVARLQADSSYVIQRIPSQRITQQVGWALLPEGDSILWSGGTDGLVRIALDSLTREDLPYAAYVRRVSLRGDSLVFGGVQDGRHTLPVFDYSLNAMRFEYAAPTFDGMIANRFQYFLEGFDPGWSDWTEETRRDYTNLPEGQYRFRVRVRNIYDRISEEDSYPFRILPPWYRSWWAYGLYLLLFVAGVWGLSRWRSRQLEAEKEALEEIVRQRTAQIEAQKEKLAAQTRQLRELDLLKSRFFANISHEFRTPLTLILGPLEERLAQAPALPDRETDRMMHRNAQRLLRLVNQLLDLSRLESGSLKLLPEKAELASFFRAVISAFHSRAEQREIAFEIRVPDREWEIWLDRDKLEKILYNLLSNAFQFTPQGGAVTVGADFDEAAAQYSLRIHNTGSYIPPSQRELIFDRFHQMEGDQHQGTGIGLALVRELVNLYGGSIDVESDRESGTAFFLTLPVLLPATEPALSGPALPPEVVETLPVAPTGREMTVLPEDAPQVLIVEDNDDVRAYLRKGIESGYHIREAADGLQGLDMAREHLPDLIISDLMMPHMDGVELCRHLKTDERTSHIPLILLTAKADVESRIEGLQTGADDYLTKPFDQEELRVRIQNLIEQRKQLRRRFSRQVLLQPKDIAITSADERFLERALALMEQQFADPDFHVQAFREAMGMSKTQLHRKLTALTDQSPVEFIRSYRLQRAAQLLAGQYENVSQVAFAVGFNNLSYFARSFRELYGVNPSEYVPEN